MPCDWNQPESGALVHSHHCPCPIQAFQYCGGGYSSEPWRCASLCRGHPLHCTFQNSSRKFMRAMQELLQFLAFFANLSCNFLAHLLCALGATAPQPMRLKLDSSIWVEPESSGLNPVWNLGSTKIKPVESRCLIVLIFSLLIQHLLVLLLPRFPSVLTVFCF